MMTSFRIQASNPRALHQCDKEDVHIGDAMQTVFPMSTEDAYLVWNAIHVPISYKYTMSFLIQDVVVMLERMLGDSHGQLNIAWPSDDFAATWQMKWAGDDLDVRADWHSVVGGTEALLASRPTLAISKTAFAAEWKQVLGISLRALIDAGYRDEELVDLARLRAVYESIPNFGVLYE